MYNTPEQILSVLLHSKIVKVSHPRSFLRGARESASGEDITGDSDEDSSDDDEPAGNELAGVSKARLSALARSLSRAYCAIRLATTAGVKKSMRRVQDQVLQQLELQPEEVVLLSTTDTSAAKHKERFKAAQGARKQQPAGGPSKAAATTQDPTVPLQPGDGHAEGAGSGDPKDESDGEQQTRDVAKTLARLAAVLTCMSHHALEAVARQPNLPALLDWLQQQRELSQLRHSLARWIRWHFGYPAEQGEDDGRTDAAWQKLGAVARSLGTTNPAFSQELLRFTVNIRLQLAQAIAASDQPSDSAVGPHAPAVPKERGGDAAPASASVLGPKISIAQVINNVLELCGDDLQYSVTPLPILEAMISKLQAAAQGIFDVSLPTAAAPAGIATPGADAGCAEPSQGWPQQTTTAAGADTSSSMAPGRRTPRRFLDLGCGAGLMAAAVYDRLVAAGWDGQQVLSQMLYVAEPDSTMQYLLAVVFPSLVPGAYYDPSGPGTTDNDGSGSSSQGASRASSSSKQSLPRNIGAVAVPDVVPPQPSPLSQQFDAILTYPPHTTAGANGITSQKLACAACEMLAPKGHALVLMHNRWRGSKGTSGPAKYPEVRNYLKEHLGDVWDVITSTRTLLRVSMAKNGGQQLVHLVKGGLSDTACQRLGYNHVHSSKAAGACSSCSCSGAGTFQPAAAAARPGFCPAAATAMSSLAGALVPGLLQQAVAEFDAIVHKDDVSTIHKVAAFRARQAALAATQAPTDPAAAAGATSSRSSAGLISLASSARFGLSLTSCKGRAGAAERTFTHTVRCYTTKQFKHASADDDAASDSESAAIDHLPAATEDSTAAENDEGDNCSVAATAEEAALQHQPGTCGRCDNWLLREPGSQRKFLYENPEAAMSFAIVAVGGKGRSCMDKP
jgi:SAM-dependent methyltransferase